MQISPTEILGNALLDSDPPAFWELLKSGHLGRDERIVLAHLAGQRFYATYATLEVLEVLLGAEEPDVKVAALSAMEMMMGHGRSSRDSLARIRANLILALQDSSLLVRDKAAQVLQIGNDYVVGFKESERN